MRFLQTTAVCLFIVVFNTAMVPFLFFPQYVFDPAVPYILFMSLLGSGRRAFGVSAGLGLVMDGFSGAPFGLYTTAYLWMTAAMRQVSTLIRVDQVWMIQLFAGLGVLFEAMVLLGMTALMDPGFRIPSAAAERIGVQMLLAAVLAPFLFSLLYRMVPTRNPSANESRPRSGTKPWRTTSKG